MIILRSPKGWTGPKQVDGHKVEGFWRAHQVPVLDVQIQSGASADCRAVDAQLQAGRTLRRRRHAGSPSLARASAYRRPPHERQPSCERGQAAQAARIFQTFATTPFRSTVPGTKEISPTETLGKFLRDVMRRNMNNFRLFSPDENASNRLQDVYEASLKTWLAEIKPEDADGTDIAPDGRVMEMLSEHTLEGWLEGYLLTGRHGLFNTYEAFVHIIDSMYNQHAKWLEKSKLELDWRAPISSLNLLISSLVWRQDHNGFTHRGSRLSGSRQQQERRYHAHLPAARRQLSAQRGGPLPAQRRLRQRHRRGQAAAPGVSRYGCRHHPLHEGHRHLGLGQQRRGRGAGRRDGKRRRHPDSGGAGRGGDPSGEHFPDLKIRFVNVVDLYRLQPDTEHPHGLSDRDFDSLFTKDKPVIFNFHGYPWLIHKFTYRQNEPREYPCARIQGKGQHQHSSGACDPEPGRPLQPGDRCYRSRSQAASAGAHLKEWLKGQIIESINYAYTEGIDKPEIRNWTWPGN